MDSLEVPVTLVVKAPNQKVADHTVQCALGWTIKKLKEHLARVYPSQPEENKQKIIYSGKLLQDHLQLKDVLRKDLEVDAHTVHLVCAHSSQPHTQPAESKTIPSASSSSSDMRSSSPASSDGLRHRVAAQQSPSTQPQSDPQQQQQQQQHGMNAYGMYYNMHGNHGNMQYTPEQMMWMQQMYAQQLYAHQYMQMYHQGLPPTPPHTPPLVQQPVHQAPVANQNAVVDNQGGANRPVNQRMNAGAAGAMFDDDEDEEQMNRDWLDWVYMMSRFGILLAIVYFYSTLGRFIFVLAFFVFMYMYQFGWFRIRRRQVRPAAQVQENQPQQQQQNQRVENQNQNEENQQHGGGEQAEPEPEPRPEPTPGVLTVAWNFFSSFFSSLIPQQPPPVNIN